MTPADRWGRDYLYLALRMEKLFPGFVDGYFGPAEWKAEVDAEPARTAAELLQTAVALGDSLPGQGFDPGRAAYLLRQVAAMETICRKLAGESISLDEEVRRCFDIVPQWTPEAEFEAALALYEEALPGSGGVAERLNARRTRFELGRERAPMVQHLMEKAMAEVRRRTLRFVDLPEGEGVTIATVTGQPWGAYNWYLGHYRSKIEVNTDLPTNVTNLLDLMAHEGYPGHHAEHVLKEQLLYRQRGYLENAILLINTPECVISEGIATLAADMIFEPGEAKRWLADEVLPEAGMEPEAADGAKLNRAAELLAGVRGNAVIMLHAEGRPAEEVVQYLMQYTLLPEERARKSMQFLQSPLWRAYTFTYYYGRRLMLPLLQGPDRLSVFRRLLTEQIYPSQLLEMAQQ
ncbi:MAG TPA: hypothetical protein VD902_03330 [Symbiobacteriaceae bacterium]|nr:hypothetical protein [Symbiobacteriaceae bacterium]